MYGNLSWWLTPLWILSVGVTCGAAVLLVLHCLLWLFSRSAAAAVFRTVREGVLQHISYLVLAFAALAVLIPAAGITRVGPILQSLGRLPYVGPLTIPTLDVPARAEDYEVATHFRSDEVQEYTITSSQDVIVGVVPG
jgi:hypothetical protein